MLALAGCDAVFGLYGELPVTDDARVDGPPDSNLDSDGSCTIMACVNSADTHDVRTPPSSGTLGPPIQNADPVVMDSTGRTFDLIVDVTPSSVSVSARDILSNETKSFGASNINLPMNYFDGVVAGAYADVNFTYWFHSQSLPFARAQR